MRISDWSSDVCSADLRAKQGGRKNRGAEVAHRFGIDRIVLARGSGVIADRDLEIMGERLADLGALLARDRGQLGVVVGGEIAREADIGGLVDLPAVAGHRAAAQLDRKSTRLNSSH